MTYNRHLYNSILYNAGREEAGALIRSLIHAHTGPHLKTVIGTDGGISFISDFVINEGSVRKPPSSFNFPDLTAAINAVQAGTDDLGSSILGLAFKDLSATLFPVAYLPDLPAFISALSSYDLSATILGELAEFNLPASIFVPVINLPAQIFGFDAPQLFATIGAHSPANLQALIWSPADLRATINFPYYVELAAAITPHLPADLTGTLYPADRIPDVSAYVKVNQTSTKDLVSYVNGLGTLSSDFSATINGGYADYDLHAVIVAVGGYLGLPAYITGSSTSESDLRATLGMEIGNSVDLPAVLTFLSAHSLPAVIGTIAVGIKDRVLPAYIQGLYSTDLSGSIVPNDNYTNLVATIRPFPLSTDLPAFLRVAETFVTAIFTVSTLSSKNLRATIGLPSCAGGSATHDLLASVLAQSKHDLQASVQSFITTDLGAKINTTNGVYYFDTIDIIYTPSKVRSPSPYFVTDTINIVYSPFRGQNLAASIFGELANIDLPASITAAFPLPRVAPTVSRVLGADLRNTEALNIQEVRLQLEGTFFDFLYVNGTDDAFIRDHTQRWRLNIRSFKPIAANMFGDFAAARVCRLGSLTSFSTIDEAVRHCIDAVLGLTSQANLVASVTGTGGVAGLPASLGIVNVFSDLSAVIARVQPTDLSAAISSHGGYTDLQVMVAGITSTSFNLSASIDPEAYAELSASITAV